MTTRWEVEHAVLRSNLSGPARLIVLALAVKSDNETAMVPPEFSPSLSTLTAMTGLARSAVAENLTRLEDLHWVKRARPSKKSKYERTSYALGVGIDDPERPASSPGGGPLASSPGGGLVREADHCSPAETDPAVREADRSDSSSPGGGPPVVREADRSAGPSSPGGGHAPTKELPTTTTNQSSSPDSESDALFTGPNSQPPATATKTKKRRTPAERGEPPKFTEFYDGAYPRKEARVNALNAWLAHVDGKEDPDEVIASAHRFAVRVAHRDREKIAMPATWINQHRWADDPPGQPTRRRAPTSPWDN